MNTEQLIKELRHAYNLVVDGRMETLVDNTEFTSGEHPAVQQLGEAGKLISAAIEALKKTRHSPVSQNGQMV